MNNKRKGFEAVKTHVEITSTVYDDDDDIYEDNNDFINSNHRNIFDRTVVNTNNIPMSFLAEFRLSFLLMKSTRLNLLLGFAPVAFIGSRTGFLGEFLCFCCAGLALIPCAERLSFVTEHVAEHTNETIGALLNATFGNAPELLISKAALQNGFYRVVQLTLLGSVLTNLLFVFGFSCLIGGLQWQTQTLRITSGNVSIGMLLVATMGIILPAVLKLANESVSNSGIDNNAVNEEITESDIAFSRFNSLAMVTGYCCYLIFQLGSHKEEFDYDGNEFENHGRYQDIIKTHHFQKDFAMKKDFVRRNNFCKRYCVCMKYCPDVEVDNDECRHLYDDKEDIQFESSDSIIESQEDRKVSLRRIPQSLETNDRVNETMREEMKRELYANDNGDSTHDPLETSKKFSSKLSDYDGSFEVCDEKEPTMSMRCGLFWLAIVTFVISLISGIIVDTIDGFAAKSNMSEVFTSVVIIPYFSNIAEQVSAVLFAYRNKMDLCIGVTVGSAIQIAQLVMPLSCICSWIMGRSMTLYFRAYETICLFLGVVCVAAVLQGGTTNWLVGVFLIALYSMIAAGFFFHENESIISTDEEMGRWR